DTGNIKGAGADPNIVVQKSSVLAAKLERVTPFQVTQCVAEGIRRISAPRGKKRWTTKVEAAAGDVNLRQGDGLRDAVSDAKVERIQLCIRHVQAKYSVEAESHFVDYCGTEGMRLI